MTTQRVPSMIVWLLLLLLPTAAASAQSSTPQLNQPGQQQQATVPRLEAMSKLLLETQHQLEQTQEQLNELRSELDHLRNGAVGATPSAAAITSAMAPAANESSSKESQATLAGRVDRQQDEQEVLQAEVKQHDQIKVETVSKYPVRVYGLLLFNAFSNAGVVDNPDLPSLAIPRSPNQSHGSTGASFRQTLLGLRADGPELFGARSSADLSIDFYGGPSYSYYGATNGSVRLRRADIRLGWGEHGEGADSSRDELHVGVDAPLISPLSPTSYATVAQPALAWSGNLWTWAPELRYKHTIGLSGEHGERTLQLEAGLWDPPVVGYSEDTAARLVSAGELSRQPGFLSRASVHGGSVDRPLSFGVGGYSSRQIYYNNHAVQQWAVTSDWQVPLSHHFRLDGEIYRGRGLGGLGGGAYKDVLTGTDRLTGLSRTVGLNAVGGWAQWKTLLPARSEFNLIYGEDDGFASDFRQLDLTASTYPQEQSARTHSIVANLIYRPKTYLILSPEYRRLLSWTITGPPSVANIYTLSLGYQF